MVDNRLRRNRETCEKCSIKLGQKESDKLKEIICSNEEFYLNEIKNFLKEDVSIYHNLKKANDYSLCLICFSKIEEILKDTFHSEDSKGICSTYIDLLKLQFNPDIYFQTINEKHENQDIDLSKLERNNLTEEDLKLLDTILEYDEMIHKIEKENIFLKQNIEKEKSRYLNVSSKLINSQSNLDGTFDSVIDNQDTRKIILSHWLSLLKRDKFELFINHLNIDSIINEWGKILFITEILIRILKVNLVEYRIYPLGINSYFMVNDERYDLSKLTIHSFNVKSREVMKKYFHILKRFDNILPEFEEIFCQEKYCFVKCINYIIDILSNIINKI